VGWRRCCDVVGGSGRRRHGFGLAVRKRERRREGSRESETGRGLGFPLRSLAPSVRTGTPSSCIFGAQPSFFSPFINFVCPLSR
jgi:hypothetical protein